MLIPSALVEEAPRREEARGGYFVAGGIADKSSGDVVLLSSLNRNVMSMRLAAIVDIN